MTLGERPAGERYHGLQKRLARFLQVPLDPPEPPPGRVTWTRSFRPDPAFLSYLKMHAAVRVFFLVFVALFLAMALIGATGGAAWALAPAVLLLALAGAWIALDLFAIRFRFDTTWYVMTDRSLRNRRGIWSLSENTVTFDNVQNLRLRQGPLERWLGIQTLVLETAASGASSSDQGSTAQQLVVEGIRDAVELRDRVAERMRLARGRGLGDRSDRRRTERVEPAAADGTMSLPVPGFALEPTHTAVLREILEEVRRLPVTELP
jgi:membrane protein YdbS with pleckstrin-like domain